jgi:hypothetical protein
MVLFVGSKPLRDISTQIGSVLLRLESQEQPVLTNTL